MDKVMTPDLIVRCTCSNLHHSVAFVRDDYGRSVLVSLDYERSFWMRLKVAWRYLWSDVCNYGDAAEVVIRDEDLPRIKAWCDSE